MLSSLSPPLPLYNVRISYEVGQYHYDDSIIQPPVWTLVSMTTDYCNFLWTLAVVGLSLVSFSKNCAVGIWKRLIHKYWILIASGMLMPSLFSACRLHHLDMWIPPIHWFCIKRECNPLCLLHFWDFLIRAGQF